MFSIKRGFLLLFFSFIGLGISRDWVHVCAPCSPTERDKMSMGIAVDPQKMEADLEKLSHKFQQSANQRTTETRNAVDAPARMPAPEPMPR